VIDEEDVLDENEAPILNPKDDIPFTEQSFFRMEYTYLEYRLFEDQTGQVGGPWGAHAWKAGVLRNQIGKALGLSSQRYNELCEKA